jgi:glucose/arabinose dehydrogenase
MNPAALLLALVPTAAPSAPELCTPPGFTASLYADKTLANDIYTITIDDAGRVLVAGRGYVRVLVEADGRAARVFDLIDDLKDGPMGLLAEGDSLYVVADGGLKRYRGYNGRDKLKTPETILAVKTAGEHDALAVRRGTDGWIYLLCGNMAGVTKKTITSPRSPVKEPVAGCLVRISPDGTQVEVVADGFRNPYSFDFNADGEPFATTDGKAFVGMIIYEATDGVILQTGPDTTVRIAGGDIESRRQLDTSLMPAGLLDELTDREVADLLAYLRTLH